MTPRAKILILTYTRFDREPRALKQARFLRTAHDVTTAGFGAQSIEGVDHVELPDIPRQRWGALGRLLYLFLLALRVHWPIPRLNALDRATQRLLGDGDWDIVIAHDLWSLAGALRLPASRGVVLDLHEYAPGENEHSPLWRLTMLPYVLWMLRTLAPQAVEFVTVGQGIADEYRRRFGFESTVVVNATPWHALAPTPVSRPIRLVHSGVAAAERRLELLVEGVRSSGADVELDFYLVPGPAGQLERLMRLAEGEPRIRFRGPVAYDRLIATLNEYDVGIAIFPPTTFNLEWCLPNKFFDFVQARLGVIIGPSPEMARYVRELGIGEVLPAFDAASLARAIDVLTPERVATWKSSSDSHAEVLSGERQMDIWGGLVERLMAGAGPAER